MHKEILTEAQVRLLPLVRRFSKRFSLVGGTAMALSIGHRRSIDFDLFAPQSFDNDRVKRMILQSKRRIERLVRDEEGQYTIMVDGVLLTFFHYPFPMTPRVQFDHIVRMPNLLTLAAMKAYALGRRAKWKDYVDLYFVMRKYGGIARIVKRARSIFGREFNEKLFREQLSYFDDIDYSEGLIYLPGFAMKNSEIKKALTRWSVME